MNLRQMEVFQAVMREGTVTDAARLLGLSQPSVSELLRRAEAALGFRLFDRIRGRLRPTAEAQALLGETETIFESVANLRQSFKALRDARFGTLAVATISALGLSLVPRLLGLFMSERPDLRARLLVKRRFTLASSIATEAIDVGFVFMPDADPRVIRREVARRKLLCIVPAGHELGHRRSVAARDMAHWPIVTYAPTQGFASLVNGLFAEAGVAYRSVIEVEDVAQVWSMVQTGIGIGVVDPFSDLGPMFPGVAARPLAAAQTVTLEAMLPRQRPVSLVTEAFVAYVAGEVGTPPSR